VATQTQSRQSMTQTNMPLTSGEFTTLETEGVGLDPRKIQSIVLADGYHDISQVSVVQFAIGVSQSPIKTTNTYPALRYVDDATGQWCISPLSQIQAYSPSKSGSQSSRQSQSR
jgi:hypothetical protein